MERTYLFVPPEEKAAVQALGARWDEVSKRWYIEPHDDSSKFARWLPDFEDEEVQDDEALEITSSQACVAAATTRCQQCDRNIEVICIYCERGTVSGEPLRRFAVSNISAMDAALMRQLRSWPQFRRVAEGGDELFANHCPECGAVQEDLYLHSEPGQVFFDVRGGVASGVVKLSALEETVRLSGDEEFQVE